MVLVATRGGDARAGARGRVDRSLLPAVAGVRLGSLDDDREPVERVAIAQRGAPHGVDLDYYADAGWPLFVVDDRTGQGYAVRGESGPVVLGATAPEAATRLLWTMLAELPRENAELLWITHDQQWAIDVALGARLELRPGASRCVRGPVGPMSPYLPSGALG